MAWPSREKHPRSWECALRPVCLSTASVYSSASRFSPSYSSPLILPSCSASSYLWWQPRSCWTLRPRASYTCSSTAGSRRRASIVGCCRTEAGGSRTLRSTASSVRLWWSLLVAIRCFCQLTGYGMFPTFSSRQYLLWTAVFGLWFD